MTNDIAFEMAVSSVRFGVGVTREVGMDLAEMGARLVLVVTDPVLAKLPPVRTVLDSLEQNKIAYALYDRVRVEPSDESFLDAIAFAKARPFDAIVAVGGGSVIDTAKAANLYTSYPPADFLDYVNPPIGKGLPVPGPLKPLIAIPTTAGTGSETTGVTIFDYKKLKREDRHRQPPAEADARLSRSGQHADDAAAGRGVRPASTSSATRSNRSPRCRSPNGRCRIVPAMRPAYQGSNPISDIWSMQALRMVNQFLVRAFDDTVGRRGAGEHAAGGVVRRRRVRQRGRASAARHVVSGVGQRPQPIARPATSPIIRSCRTACR